MDLPLVHSIWTVLLLITFVAIVLWAYVFRSKEDFDAAARMPLDDDEVGN